ncbi:MAG: hypothetical protein IJ040_05280 [Lachnospiraceae bacterium]|nr:hypothetical protein [Lachnospiraceae bacterium]
MAETLVLEPDQFQEQVDDYTGKVGTASALEYTASVDNAGLASIEKYLECVTEMNATLQLYAQLAELDGQSMQKIKAAWMNADNENATKTVAEIIFGTGSDDTEGD